MKIYLDNCATTRVCEEAAKAVWIAMTERYANPSALHTAGQEAEAVMKQARRQIAQALSSKPENIVFTGNGTEADNLALFSAFYVKPGTIGGAGGAFRQRSLVVSAIEHAAVWRTARQLADEGVRVDVVPVLGRGSEFPGMVDPREVRARLSENVHLVSVLHVNNEIGTIQPVEDIARIVHTYAEEKGVRTAFHSDCIQSFGKFPIDTLRGEFRYVDYLALSAHKIHGPKGVGALYARNPERLHPMIFGGAQEGGVRGGTENVPGIAGFGAAAKAMTADYVAHAKAANGCRRKLLEGIKAEIPDVLINSPEDASVTGKPGLCSPYILNVSFLGTRGEVILHELEKSGIYVSTGAACSSIGGRQNAAPTGDAGQESVAAGPAASRTLAAIGLSAKEAEGAIRFGFSREGSPKEMEFVVDRLKQAVARYRQVGSYR
ncbi:MAG: cysteine desulfurase [Clostridiales Family XIII bacterium]|jgi:cysteine desulfurase|nr:cysteine desulfurase [Clostridiales Family XIII bacterium]